MSNVFKSFDKLNDTAKNIVVLASAVVFGGVAFGVGTGHLGLPQRVAQNELAIGQLADNQNTLRAEVAANAVQVATRLDLLEDSLCDGGVQTQQRREDCAAIERIRELGIFD